MSPRTKQVEHSLSIAYVSPTSLRLDSKNPRQHGEKQIRQIANSIEAFGFNVPVLVDAQMNVVAGHGRVQAVRLLNWSRVPIIKLEHLTETQRAAFVIADNKLAENSSWDAKLLGEQLKILSDVEVEFNLEVLGFETAEIDILIDGCELSSETVPDPADDLPTGQEPGVSALGDVWQLGEHRVLCGDSLDSDSYQVLMQGKKASLVVADAPYNVAIHGHATGLGKIRHREFAMAAGEMTSIQFTEFLKKAMRTAVANSMTGSLGFYFMDWRHMAEILDAGKEVYSDLLNLCVWTKTNGGMGSFYRSSHELVFVFRHGKGAHLNNVQLGRFGRNRTNVWSYAGANSFSRTSREGNLLAMHPTVKPVALVADAIRDVTARGELVLDPFLGSGTTMIAAERTGRVCYGIELDPKYTDTIVRRWQAFTRKTAIHAHSGQPFGKRN